MSEKLEHTSEELETAWAMVDVEDFEEYDRPESQGGTWVLAQRMKVIKTIGV